MIREESLVAGDEDVRKSKQPGKNIVLQDLRRAIGKEKTSLLLIDIDGEMADMPLF